VDLQQKIGQKVKRLQVDDIIVLPFVLVSGNLNWNVAFPGCTRFGWIQIFLWQLPFGFQIGCRTRLPFSGSWKNFLPPHYREQLALRLMLCLMKGQACSSFLNSSQAYCMPRSEWKIKDRGIGLFVMAIFKAAPVVGFAFQVWLNAQPTTFRSARSSTTVR